MQLIYKPFEDDDEEEPGEPEPYELLLEEQSITDVKSAAGAPPRPPAGERHGGVEGGCGCMRASLDARKLGLAGYALGRV